MTSINRWVVLLVLLAGFLKAAEPSRQPTDRRLAPVARGNREFDSATDLNAVYVHDFATKPGVGWSRIPLLPPQDFLTLDGQRYRITRPDLVGLADQPMAYEVNSDFPTAAEFARKAFRDTMRRRPLTELEQSAVIRLRAGETLVVAPEAPDLKRESATVPALGIRVVGALRAQSSCLPCHSVAEGTVLGALSYRGEPVEPVEPVKPGLGLLTAAPRRLEP